MERTSVVEQQMVATLRAQLGRSPLEPAVPGVPPGMFSQALRFGAIGVVSIGEGFFMVKDRTQPATP